jgi:uncharacterized membrane protein YfcA
MAENLLLVLTGLIGGTIAGLTGIGTGFLMVAILPWALVHFGVPEEYIVRTTIANSVFATMISSLANMVTSIHQKNFHLRETLWVALGAVTCSFIAFEFIAKSPYYSRELFNAVVIFFMFIIIVQTFKKMRLSNFQNEQVTHPRLVLTGSAAGTAAALTGLGGGTLIIPMLNLWQKVDILKAKSISFGTIFTIALWLSINNLFLEPAIPVDYSLGLIVIPMIIPIAVGVLIGSPLGVVLSHKMPARTITLLFLLVISAVAIQKIAELVWMER